MSSHGDARANAETTGPGTLAVPLLELEPGVGERVLLLPEARDTPCARLPGGVPGGPEAEAPLATLGDAALAGAVRRALAWDLWVPEARLTVTVSAARVTLEGEVNSRFQREAALTDALGVEGVREVCDRLSIVPTPAGDEVEGCIARGLGTDRLPPAMRVETFPGGVLLRGRARSPAERAQAEAAARAVSGVREVCNRLEVTDPPARGQPAGQAGARHGRDVRTHNQHPGSES